MARKSLTDLLAQKAAIEQQIAELQRAHRADAIAQVKALMTEYGLSAADVGGAAGPAEKAPRSPAEGKPPAPVKRRKPSASAGRKVAPKYRNPATGDTWSGRGLKPKWLSAQLSAGRSLSDFAI